MSPIVRVLEEMNADYYMLHTCQHYSYNMAKLFFEDLELPKTNYKLDVGEKYHTQGAQTGEMIKAMERIFMDNRPDVVLTDSGGLQEETNILHVPCFTLRNNTERPETVSAGYNVVVGVEPDVVLRKVSKLMEYKELEEKMRTAEIVFGKGNASEKIVEIISERYEDKT